MSPSSSKTGAALCTWRLPARLPGVILALVIASSGNGVAGVEGNKVRSVGALAAPTLAPMLSRVLPGVVGISIVQDPERVNPLLSDPFFRQFFEQSVRGKLQRAAPAEPRPAGSGVIIDAARGLVLSNHHVIRDASRVVVVLTDRREVVARVLGSDAGTDIALLKIEADHLVAVPVNDSKAVRVGDFVVAVGNPFGIGQTVTSGIVSAISRGGLSPEGYEDYIQTDAAINPGNSGGALLNHRGELIGINTAILTGGQGNRGNIGIGFAIPMSMAREVIGQIKRYGEVRRGTIGIKAVDLGPRLADQKQLMVREGALVSGVEAGSTAELAGVRVDDVVLLINGQAVRGSADLRNRLALIPVGGMAQLSVQRGRQRLSIPVTVAAVTPGGPTNAAGPETAATEPTPTLAGDWGLQVAAAEDRSLTVLSVDPDSRAHSLGLRTGDSIVALNREPLASAEQLASALSAPGEKTLSILRGKSKLRFQVP